MVTVLAPAPAVIGKSAAPHGTPANDEAGQRVPPALVTAETVTHPTPQRLVIIELFAELQNDLAKRKPYTPIGQIAISATSLHTLETQVIGQNIERLNQARAFDYSLGAERLAHLQVMIQDNQGNRRATYSPEWRESIIFTPERPLNAENFAAALTEAALRNGPRGTH